MCTPVAAPGIAREIIVQSSGIQFRALHHQHSRASWSLAIFRVPFALCLHIYRQRWIVAFPARTLVLVQQSSKVSGNSLLDLQTVFRMLTLAKFEAPRRAAAGPASSREITLKVRRQEERRLLL